MIFSLLLKTQRKISQNNKRDLVYTVPENIKAKRAQQRKKLCCALLICCFSAYLSLRLIVSVNKGTSAGICQTEYYSAENKENN